MNDHTHLPQVSISIHELHPFLRPIFRVGGGDFRAAYIGGMEDPAILLTHNRLYRDALYLAYDNETGFYSPALLRDGQLQPVATLQSAAIWLPNLANAYAIALKIYHPKTHCLPAA